MKPAIRVENLSKQYRIGTRARSGVRNLTESIVDSASALWRGLTGRGRQGDGANEFWALKDVSFEVRPGEVLGIIGSNGAGKSTLLKVLSRIAEPTSGQAVVRGRMGSLLEVGTGFHPELTGRENIYLNGSILGMSRREIDLKFEEIVAFSDIERFLDTPVKRYSSGMYVRLAFSVAAHLEPEILVLDEVLAVGDAAFQEKCMGQIQRTASHGRTILFVSHNMASIQQLCTRALILRSGEIVLDGKPSDIVQAYMSQFRLRQAASVRDWTDRETNGQARLISLEVGEHNTPNSGSVSFGSDLHLTIGAEFYEAVRDPQFGVFIHTTAGEPLLDIRSAHSALRLGEVRGQVTVHVMVERLGLHPGEYLLSPWITDAHFQFDIDWVKHCSVLKVHPTPMGGRIVRLVAGSSKYWVPSSWRVAERASEC